MAKTHGKRFTRLYSTWLSMKDRCFNPKCKSYPRYGARGITVCDEWKNDFQSFYNWAMLNGYTDTLTIDRIDNDGNYHPDNCRWVTRRIQNNNKSSNILITRNGETYTLSEWEQLLGVKKNLLYSRIYHYGMSVEEAFSYKRKYDRKDIEPLQAIGMSGLSQLDKKIVELRISGLGFREIGNKCNLSKTTIRNRIWNIINKNEVDFNVQKGWTELNGKA